MGRSRAIQTMQRRRGVALITAILIATIAAAAAVAISVEQNIAIMRTANIVAAGRAEELLASVEFLALDALTLDAKHSQFDDLSEAWSKTPLQAGNASGDSSGSIEDLQGRFNLTNLAPSYHGAHPVMADPRNDELGGADSTNTTTTRQRLAEVRFRLLLNTLDIDAVIVQAILDWADTDSETRFPNGAEDDYYLGLSQPYRTGNWPLTSVRELLLIRGVNRKIFATLEPFVVAVSEPTPININTAPQPVLMSLAPDIDGALASMLIRVRETQPFTSVHSFTSHPLLFGRKISAADITISSNWFVLMAVTRIASLQFRSSTTFYRNGGRARMRGRRYGYFDG